MLLLELVNITKHFGGLAALSKVSLKVEKGAFIGLIGPNGSGKTTLFNVVTGFLKCNSGRVFFAGEDITNLKPYEIARKGIGRTFQLTRLFNRLTVLQNLMVASPYKTNIQSTERAQELLRFVGLSRLQDEEAWNLSYGQMKLLELARALMLDPTLMLLDEPTAGVNPVLKEEIVQKLKGLNEMGKTILLIEHDIQTMCKLCEKVAVLVEGEKRVEAAPQDLEKIDLVRKAYFLE